MRRDVLKRILALDLEMKVLLGPKTLLPGAGLVPLLAPRPEHIMPELIGRALSREGRYANLGQQDLTVAEHSWLVSMLCPEAPLQGLLHDAAEAVIGDMTAPLKRLLRMLEGREMSSFDVVDELWWEAIAMKFGLPPEKHPRIDIVDKALRVVEQHVLFPGCEHLFDTLPGVGPSWLAEESLRLGLGEPLEVRCLPSEQAYELFMDRLRELWPPCEVKTDSTALLGGA